MKSLVRFFLRPRRFREFGQTLALMAIALPAVIGGMGLATDVGNFYFNYYKMQTAVDAAAIAGALCLPSETTCKATTTAKSYASTDGITAGEVTVTGPSYNTTTCPSGGAYQPCQLTVSGKRSVPYYFSRLIGVNSGSLNVTATAAGGTVTTITSSSSENGGTMSSMMPIGLQYNSSWSNGNPITMVYNSNGGKCASSPGGSLPGDWDWLALGASGEATLESNITKGYDGTITAGGTVKPEPGAGQSAFGSVQTRIGGTACSYGCNCGSPCAIDVVLVDWATLSCGGGGGGACTPITVKGFASMCIDSATKVGACSVVTAHAITCPVSGGSWTTTSSSTSQIQDGALAVQLVQ
jgi:Flp pilus assembly protein TadG